MDELTELKMILRENDMPFFSDEELEYHLKKNNNDVNATAYRCLLLKAEDTSLQISGFTSADTSKYFRRIAQQYRPNNSCILRSE